MVDIQLVHRLQAAPSYQDRPELTRVEAWWCGLDAGGVCALVGLGGAGKTAIVERFLERLRRSVAGSADDGLLPVPDRVFVFSFYDEPIADVFFSALASGLTSAPAEAIARRPSHFEVFEALRATKGRVLLILDGLERVQNDGRSGGLFGEVDDTSLRDLLVRAATGLLGGTAVLTTTRFPVTPLEREAMPGFVRIDVGGLSEEAAGKLVRAQGVEGDEEEIRSLVNRFGRHALLVDLAARYLTRLGGKAAGGIAELSSEAEEEIDEALAAELDPSLRAALALQRRFARITRRYRDQLEARDPEALALLQLACAFRDGVREAVLVRVRAKECGARATPRVHRALLVLTAGAETARQVDLPSLVDTVRIAWDRGERLTEAERMIRDRAIASLANRVWPEDGPTGLLSDYAAAARERAHSRAGVESELRFHARAARAAPAKEDIGEAGTGAPVRSGGASVRLAFALNVVAGSGGMEWERVELDGSEPQFQLRVDADLDASRKDPAGNDDRGAYRRVFGQVLAALRRLLEVVEREERLDPLQGGSAVAEERPALSFLAELGLIDRRDGRILVHPAVREGFAASDPEAERSAHERAAEVLRSSANLSGIPYAGPSAHPSACEELLHHLIEAGDSKEAWSFYQRRVGGFLRVGTQLAAYGQGDSILRLFVHGASPIRAPRPDLAPLEIAAFLNEWGLYLHRLGQLAGASACFSKSAQIAAELGRGGQASIALQNLAETESMRGHLPRARATLIAAAEMLAKSSPEPPKERPEVCFVRESRSELLPYFIDVGASHDDASCAATSATIDQLLARGAWIEAETLARRALIGADVYYQSDRSAYHTRALLDLAEVARERAELPRAVGCVEAAKRWALQNSDRDLLARALLETARIGIERVRRGAAADRRTDEAIAEGVRLARDSEYALLSIELRLARAELALLRGREAEALGDIERALADATHPECGFGRGELRAQVLTARLHAARADRARSARSDVRAEVIAELEALDRAIAVAKRLKSPELLKLLEQKDALLGGRPIAAAAISGSSARAPVAIVYGHLDARWTEGLLAALSPAVARDRIVLVHDALLDGGMATAAELQAIVGAAKVVIVIAGGALLESEVFSSSVVEPALALPIVGVRASDGVFAGSLLEKHSPSFRPEIALASKSAHARRRFLAEIREEIVRALVTRSAATVA
jgi:hypothetical protein